MEQNREVGRLPPVGEVERRHLGFVSRRLGPLESFAVHVIDVGEDAFAGAGHADLLDGLSGETRGLAGGLVELFVGRLQQVALGGVEQVAAGGGWRGARGSRFWTK